MRQQNDLDSYHYISAGSTIITVATIVLSIMIVLLGVITSIAYNVWWLCLIIIPSGGISIAVFYVFGKMAVATCHNIYVIKANTDKTLMIQQTKLSKKKPNEAHILKQIEILNENDTDDDFDYENLPEFDECPNCFAKISPNDIECPNCGYKLKEDKKQEE